MNAGLLWYDASKTSLHAKLAPAILRYRERFGANANVCYVSPTNMPVLAITQVAGVRIEPSPTVLLHHLWLTREEKEVARQ